jgi:hypothetical protein
MSGGQLSFNCSALCGRGVCVGVRVCVNVSKWPGLHCRDCDERERERERDCFDHQAGCVRVVDCGHYRVQDDAFELLGLVYLLVCVGTGERSGTAGTSLCRQCAWLRLLLTMARWLMCGQKVRLILVAFEKGRVPQLARNNMHKTL